MTAIQSFSTTDAAVRGISNEEETVCSLQNKNEFVTQSEYISALNPDGSILEEPIAIEEDELIELIDSVNPIQNDSEVFQSEGGTPIYPGPTDDNNSAAFIPDSGTPTQPGPMDENNNAVFQPELVSSTKPETIDATKTTAVLKPKPGENYARFKEEGWGNYWKNTEPGTQVTIKNLTSIYGKDVRGGTLTMLDDGRALWQSEPDQFGRVTSKYITENDDPSRLANEIQGLGAYWTMKWGSDTFGDTGLAPVPYTPGWVDTVPSPADNYREINTDFDYKHIGADDITSGTVGPAEYPHSEHSENYERFKEDGWANYWDNTDAGTKATIPGGSLTMLDDGRALWQSDPDKFGRTTSFCIDKNSDPTHVASLAPALGEYWNEKWGSDTFPGEYDNADTPVIPGWVDEDGGPEHAEIEQVDLSKLWD